MYLNYPGQISLSLGAYAKGANIKWGININNSTEPSNPNPLAF